MMKNLVLAVAIASIALSGCGASFNNVRPQINATAKSGQLAKNTRKNQTFTRQAILKARIARAKRLRQIRLAQRRKQLSRPPLKLPAATARRVALEKRRAQIRQRQLYRQEQKVDTTDDFASDLAGAEDYQYPEGNVVYPRDAIAKRSSSEVNATGIPAPELRTKSYIPPQLALTSPANKFSGDRKVVISGKPSRVGHFSLFSRDCKPGQLPELTIKIKPTNGTAWVAPSFVTIKSGACAGKTFPTLGVYYRSNNGYRGDDAFKVVGKQLPGQPKDLVSTGTIKVTVR